MTLEEIEAEQRLLRQVALGAFEGVFDLTHLRSVIEKGHVLVNTNRRALTIKLSESGLNCIQFKP